MKEGTSMNELKFIQVQKDNPQHCEAFKDLMHPYNRERGAHAKFV